MSYNFDGVDDYLLSSPNQIVGTQYSIAAWFDADSKGEGGAGYCVTNGPLTAERFVIFWYSGGTNQLMFTCRWTSANGFWYTTTPFSSIPGWKWIMVTYDAGATTNDPMMYLWNGSTFSTLTVGSGLTEHTTPAGSLPADSQTVRIGHDSSGAYTWDGRIAEVAFWKRLLSANEAHAVFTLGVNAIPDHYYYVPLDGGVQNLGSTSSVTNFAATGATPAENAPTRAAGRRG
jgi:hypothetical protein